MWLRSLPDSLMPRPNPKRTRRAAPRPATCRLAVESLEDRCTPAAVLSVWDAMVLEGNTGTQNAVVTVTLSEPHSNVVSVNYRTADGTAIAGSDYNAVSGTLTFAKNQMSKTILVPVIGDRVPEPDRYFFVRLDSSKAGAKIANGQAVVTIVDDEPRVSINDVSAVEGNSGTTPFTFTISLSRAYDLPVTVDWATANGTAIAGLDYAAAGDQWTFTPGQTSKQITVAVTGDRLPEPDKTFFVNLSTPNSYAAISRGMGVGTLIDDEPRISIYNAYNYSESTITFTVYLSRAYDQDVTVDFATENGTAMAGPDYVTAAGTLTFDHVLGETTKTITIEIDPTSMYVKYFYVHLSGASPNALILNEWATGYGYGYDDGSGYNFWDYDWGVTYY
jgi:hypothetical protein